MADFINGTYKSKNLSFQFGKNDTNVSLKSPSLLQRLFRSTVKIEVHEGTQTKQVRLKLKDVKTFLESNGFSVSLLNRKQKINLFYEFINQNKTTENKPLIGKCLKGKIALDVWKDDPVGIKVANFWHKIFRSTTELSIQDGNNLQTYTVLSKDLSKKAKAHGINLSEISNLALINHIRGQGDKPLSRLTLNTIPGQFLMTQAAPSFDKKGALIRGSEQVQESLLLGNMKGDQFALTVYDKRPKTEAIFLEVNGREVYISAEELANRYHLSLEEVIKESADGKFEELLSSNKFLLELLSNILENYTHLFEKQSRLKKSDLKPAILMKIVRLAVKNETFGKDPVLKGKACLNGEEYLPMFEGKKLHLLRTTNKKLAGKGAYSEVYKVENTISKKQRAIKVGTPLPHNGFTTERLYELSKESIENEFSLLKILHEEFPGGGYVPGIQRPGQSYTLLSTNGQQTAVMSGHAYNKDLLQSIMEFDSRFDALDKKLDAFYELLKGYEYCVVKKKLGHGDIKPENILCEGDKLFLADFGGARILGIGTLIGAMSPQYFPVLDLLKLGNPDIEPEEFNAGFTSKDVYSLGSTFFILLTGHYAYSLKKYDSATGPYNYSDQKTYTPEGYLPKQAPFNKDMLEKKQIPAEMIAIVEGMTKLNPDERMGISEVLKNFDAYRKQRGQTVLELL